MTLPAVKVTTRDFFAALYPDIPEGAYVELRAGKLDGSILQRWAHDPNDLLVHARPHINSAHLWYGPGLRTSDTGDSDKDVGWLPALWADVDAKCFPNETVDEVWDHVVTFSTPPSIVINSGNGLQCYWLLDGYATGDAIVDACVTMRGIATALSLGLAHKLDSVHNPSRVLRIPNSYNHKSVPPKLVTTVVFNPQLRYPLNILRDAFPAVDLFPGTFHGYTDTDFSYEAGIDLKEVISRARARGCIGWVLDSIYKPDLYDRGDESSLDWAMIQELVKCLAPGEIEFLWLNTEWGNRDKVQQRADYRRGTIWKAYSAYQVTLAPVQVAPGSPGASGQQRVYVWAGGLLQLVGRRTNTILANFKPELLREIEIVEDTGDTIYEYDVRFARTGDRIVTLRLANTDMESDAAFKRKLTGFLPADFLIYPAGWQHLSTAIFELALDDGYIRDRAYASMGWAPGVHPPVYILPGAGGGISAQGLDANYRLNETAFEDLPERMRLYGIGMRPITNEDDRTVALRALNALLSIAEPHIIVPLMVQVLAGPLSPYGMRRVPPILHLLGPTGSFKTTMVTAALSLFGLFDGQRVPESWISTQNALLRRLYEARHVTLLFDDYKSGKAEPVSLIQSYADGTSRSRMGTDQSNRVSLQPRGLLISTGEDVWEEHESTNARTITIRAERPSHEAMPQVLLNLTEAQRAASNGELALVGGQWVTWIAKHHLDLETRFLDLWTETAHTLMLSSNIHPRLISTLASLFTAAEIIGDFLSDELPEAAAQFKEGMALTRASLLEGTTDDAEEAAQLQPYAWVTSEVVQAFVSGAVRFTHRSSSIDRSLGTVFSDSIGFYDEDNLYFTQSRTFKWLQQQSRSTGKVIHFSWRAFCQGVRRELGPFLHKGVDRRTSYVVLLGGKLERCVVIPRTILGGADIIEESSQLVEGALSEANSDGIF